jgi:hypothetical protein
MKDVQHQHQDSAFKGLDTPVKAPHLREDISLAELIG